MYICIYIYIYLAAQVLQPQGPKFVAWTKECTQADKQQMYVEALGFHGAGGAKQF